VSRDRYSPNPFPESPEIARYIEANSAADDRIAVLGSEPQLFFYSKRKSATGHIYIYGLMEDQPYADLMQQEMIADIEAARPLYLVFVRVNYSWGFDDKSPKRLFRWADAIRRPPNVCRIERQAGALGASRAMCRRHE
jgi:hypothetical protein